MRFSITILTLIVSTSIAAQSWEELNKKVTEYYDAGNYEEALPYAEKALNLSKEEFINNHVTYYNYAVSLYNLENIYVALERNIEAEKLYKESIRISKGVNDHDYWNSLINLGVLYENTGRNIEAEPLYIESIKVRKELLGSFHINYASALYNLAWLYDDLGRYEEAEPLYLESIDIKKEQLGEKILTMPPH